MGRMRRTVERVRAAAKTDDGRVSITFDAIPWFETANTDSIKALVACGFAEDPAASVVFTAHPNPTNEMQKLSGYLEVTDSDFEVLVNKNDALKWLGVHRPELLLSLVSKCSKCGNAVSLTPGTPCPNCGHIEPTEE